jgi:hypothetical protein
VTPEPIRTSQVEGLPVRVYESEAAMGAPPPPTWPPCSATPSPRAARPTSSSPPATRSSPSCAPCASTERRLVEGARLPHGRVRGDRPRAPRLLPALPPRALPRPRGGRDLLPDDGRVRPGRGDLPRLRGAAAALPGRRRRARLRRERPPRVQRPALRRLRRPGLGQARPARRGQPQAAARRGPLRHARRGPDARDHADGAGPARREARALHRARGAQGERRAGLPARARLRGPPRLRAAHVEHATLYLDPDSAALL